MSEAHKRSYRHPKCKIGYHVKNWPEYEKSLRDRGDITVWLSQDAIDTWTPLKTGRLGGQQIYSDIAIEIALTLRLVFYLPLRQMEGFLRSILKIMGLDLPCPDHTTVSRRNRTVDVRNHIDRLPKGPMCFIVDSTGLMICGQGEWHSKKHGEKWRKGWKKLHVGVDGEGRILASTVTDGHDPDPSQVPGLLTQVGRQIDRFVGDGVYDRDKLGDRLRNSRIAQSANRFLLAGIRELRSLSPEFAGGGVLKTRIRRRWKSWTPIIRHLYSIHV